MAITLGSHTLPDGLRWEDEYDWSALVQRAGYLVTGALLVEQSERQAGRPITLVGGRRWAWMRRAELQSLHSALTAPDATFTLTLHDGRQFTVMPRVDRAGPIVASLLPIVSDSGPADPDDESRYIIERVRLIVVE
jgi:hypothetical protein